VLLSPNRHNHHVFLQCLDRAGILWYDIATVIHVPRSQRIDLGDVIIKVPLPIREASILLRAGWSLEAIEDKEFSEDKE
jgi:hypothetical protein